jgi:hypothetical protein
MGEYLRCKVVFLNLQLLALVIIIKITKKIMDLNPIFKKIPMH